MNIQAFGEPGQFLSLPIKDLYMRVHFIGVGENGMQELAYVLRQGEVMVSGSDVVPGNAAVNGEGPLPKILGWSPEKLDVQLDAVIVGSQIPLDNPELLRAAELGLKIYSIAEFLYERTQYGTRVVIAGSKGSAAVTSMVLHVMEYHNRPIDFVLATSKEGGQMLQLTRESDFVVFEGGEGPNAALDTQPAFSVYRPNIALLTDIHWEPSPNFPTYDAYLERFQSFVDSIVKGGSITYNQEDKAVRSIVEASENTIRKLPYGTPEHLEEDGQLFLITPEGPMSATNFGDIAWVEGAKWICQHMGIDADDFYEAIAIFEGVNGM